MPSTYEAAVALADLVDGGEPPEGYAILTREEVLAWRAESWAPSDIALIARRLDAVGEAIYYVPPSASYIGVRPVRDGVTRQNAFSVHPGYLHYGPGDWGQGGVEYDELTTIRLREQGRPGPEAQPACPTCWTELPVTGVCGVCA